MINRVKVIPDDISEKIKNILGKLTGKPSVATATKLLEELTKLLKGKKLTAATFSEIGLNAAVHTNSDGAEELHVKVPKQYVASNVTENRDEQYVVFDISQQLSLNTK